MVCFQLHKMFIIILIKIDSYSTFQNNVTKCCTNKRKEKRKGSAKKDKE